MKKVVAWVVILMLVFTNTGFALDLGSAFGDAFGGLTAMFAPDAEDAHLPGEVVELDKMNIALTNVYESKGSDFYTPAEGMEYMMIEFAIENTGDEELTLSTMLNFSTWCDGENRTISLEALATGMLAGRMQLDCVVEPGKSVTGIIGYEIPVEWEEVIVEYCEEIVLGQKTSFVITKDEKAE